MNERRVAIVGIDPSSRKLAICITVHGKPDIDMRTIRLAERDRKRACGQAYDAVQKVIEDYLPNHQINIFLEEPVLGRGGARATISQSKIDGGILACAFHYEDNGVVLVDVNNSAWKKAVVASKVGSLGRRTEDQKAKIAEFIQVHWPEAYTTANGDLDLHDAACINRYGKIILERSKKLTTAKKRRLSVVRSA